MIFNSLSYAVYLPVCCVLFFLLPVRLRLHFLLAASYFFYMCWNAQYAALMLLSTLTTYLAALCIKHATLHSLRRTVFLSSLIFNIVLLLMFKYFDFINELAAVVLGLIGIVYIPSRSTLLLPVGISFYTFQALGFLIDSYNGNAELPKLSRYALFVSFFPQLVAGPIERYEHLMPQFDRPTRFDSDRTKSALLLISRGLIKKIVIADNLSPFVNMFFNRPHEYSGVFFMFAAVLFAFQIYCDFSGYTDIAIGSARILGYDLTQNFNRPYAATSITDFWKRWHISLTSWFRSYIYIPLGGNRKHRYLNIIIVFLVSGLWHGANLTFVLWGLVNGLLQIIEDTWKKHVRIRHNPDMSYVPLTYRLIKRCTVFLMICFTWIFFRAQNLSELLVILKKFLSPSFFSGLMSLYLTPTQGVALAFCIAAIILLLVYEALNERYDLASCLAHEPVVTRWIVYCCLFIVIAVFGVYGNADASPFIYFQF